MKKTSVGRDQLNPSEQELWDAIRGFLEHMHGVRNFSKVPEKR